MGGAFANVDRQAGVFTQMQQFLTGISKIRELVADEQRERADNETAAALERKRTASRRFNSGDAR